MAASVEQVKISDCTGCTACINICPVNAIKMKPNSEGFLYPDVDKEKCVSCGLCYSKCPSVRSTYKLSRHSEIYAAYYDDETRMKSSSGAAFTVLARYAFSKGGAVAGAAWTEDHRVKHIIINDETELDRLRRSKYMQSDMGDTFSRVKELLEQQTFVLFSGCPCQIAGLYAYLGKTPENLFTVDVVCHGVPSPFAFEKYLSEISEGRKLVEYNFRDKSKGWTTPGSVVFEDGSSYYMGCREDPYYIAFLNGISTRLSCGSCVYSSPQRIGDITLGDFWGISEINPAFTDGKGTSLVMLNTQKGKKIFEEVKAQFKLAEPVPEEIVIDVAKRKNGQLVAPKPPHKNRKLFFSSLMNKSFSKAVFEASEKKYDIGVVGWWYNENYGGTLTYFALHSILRKMGLTVLMIEKAYNSPGFVPDYTTVPRRFAKKYYSISPVYPAGQLGKLNEVCNAFISGSDQLFNPSLWKYSGPQYYIDFASPERKIISYASSFGNTLVCSDKHKMLMSYYLRRFDALSVREDYAVDIMAENFGLKAQKVLDPVFVCDREEYEKLADSSDVKTEEKYFVDFVLDPDESKREAVLYLHEKLGLPYVNLLNATDFEKNSKLLGLDNTFTDVDVEDFLKYYRNAEFIITDSFHGTCFAIIFRKPFISVLNKKRGVNRFISMLTELGLENRMVSDVKEIYTRSELLEQIDYTATERILEPLRKSSYDWLKNAVFGPFDKAQNEFSVIDSKMNKTVNTVSNLTAQVNELRRLVDMLSQGSPAPSENAEKDRSIFRRAAGKLRRLIKR